MPTSCALLLRLDGVLHNSDLPVQSFARHLTEALPAELVRPMIAGMRGFLENKPELLPVGADFGAAEDGYQAVEHLALSAGLSPQHITAAYRASRRDLSGSAWAVDAQDGLPELLAGLSPDVALAVYAEPGDPAAPAVLEAVELGQVELFAAPLPGIIDQLLGRLDPASRPDRILVVGTRWDGELDLAAAAGCRTALVDRYRRRRGSPDVRAADLAGLTEHIRSWAGLTKIAADGGRNP
ncbi:MAG: hypothetical protein ABWZ98_04495 [Nakamurella sp.]